MNNETYTKQSQTDWARIDAMTDEEIDLTDCPKVTEEMWTNGMLMKNFKPFPRKNQENLPVDKDIIEFFKTQGFNYPAKINQLLREYMDEQQIK